MKTAQNYVAGESHANASESTARNPLISLPLAGELPPADAASQQADLEFLSLQGTLMNVRYLTRNPLFAQKHPGVAENALSELIASMSQAVSQLDPLILEALSSRFLQD